MPQSLYLVCLLIQSVKSALFIKDEIIRLNINTPWRARPRDGLAARLCSFLAPQPVLLAPIRSNTAVQTLPELQMRFSWWQESAGIKIPSQLRVALFHRGCGKTTLDVLLGFSRMVLTFSFLPVCGGFVCSSCLWWLPSNNVTGCHWEPGLCQCRRSPQHRDCPPVPEPSEPLSAHQQPRELGLCRRSLRRELWTCSQPSRHLHLRRVHPELSLHSGLRQRGRRRHHHHRLQGTVSRLGCAGLPPAVSTRSTMGCRPG